MRFSSAILTSVLAVSSLVSAVPTQRRPSNTKMLTPRPKTNAAGAAYFITNEGKGNMIIAASISADGTLSLDRAVSTGGSGAHGQTDPIGPDALFAQGSIKASAKGQVLAAVNAGSNTISLFSINPKSPAAISQIGAPAPSQGEFPISVAFNADGTRLCALNGGKVNGVACYNVDKQAGLKPIANSQRSLNLNQTTPATGPAGSASHVIFSEDGSQLLASVKGVPPTPGFIAVWDVQADGSLSADFKSVAPPSGGALPFSMTLIPGKNALLSTDPALGFDVFDLGSGNASSAVPITGQSATCWSSFSKKTGNFYLTDIGTSTVTEVNVDANLKASIVAQYSQTAGSATIDNDIATIKGNDFLYVLAPNATQVDVLSLQSAGNAKHISTLDISGPTKAAGVTINPANLQGFTTFIKQ
ncbi:hypothetical protein BD309DRAFT_276048 [Dichomitus squalens]|uniref:3-carboxymuconate cyclase n=2 Tax=Dichomitus squalens TaxID=114155 RepID=A0A4Q9PPI8_9APHY|nr:uncharacterized protein DICSQDRAFT_94454 [Dichomitus squalens LYAD-421 SS1]EJF55787.1 hypothetical protein DICSQDRAFT_94454 [Dichomitus squalens LYAD-421 SS1]TBU30183.1 hypothetical protein BD311DRAFT_230620 [Dichomitus squalens]TBU41371.1 hypothetical protein BD309DRAFT_276048 [Dichomitus squalens]TBU56259.1 hypothetical protein BD310DRAFT_632053 [Dichomitus squalens]